jgi:hypothetical protein
VIEIPDDVTSFGRRTVVFLTVYTCPGVSTCTQATGRMRLRAKVAIFDESGFTAAGDRDVQVLAWSVQR